MNNLDYAIPMESSSRFHVCNQGRILATCSCNLVRKAIAINIKKPPGWVTDTYVP